MIHCRPSQSVTDSVAIGIIVSLSPHLHNPFPAPFFSPVPNKAVRFSVDVKHHQPGVYFGRLSSLPSPDLIFFPEPSFRPHPSVLSQSPPSPPPPPPILPSTTAVFSYGPENSSNEQFFVGARTVVSLLKQLK